MTKISFLGVVVSYVDKVIVGIIDIDFKEFQEYKKTFLNKKVFFHYQICCNRTIQTRRKERNE